MGNLESQNSSHELIEQNNKEVNELQNLVDSGNLEEVNTRLNENFLENLKNWLHLDTANQLKGIIESINWYQDDPEMKQLYDYVVSICESFNTPWEDTEDHDINRNVNIHEFINENEIRSYDNVIQSIEYLNIIIKDSEMTNRLTAIKGIIHWNKLTWNSLVKIAEFLGIDTKRDNRYWSRRIKNLWEKVFSMTDEKWLFAKLWKMYEHMDTNTNVVNFRNNSFEGRSLNDICNLLKINWNWDDINKTDPKVTLFCRSLKLNSETFAQQFNAKNLYRKNTNTEALNNFSILSLLDPNKAITKTETEWTYKYGEIEFTQANFLTQLGITPDTIKTNLEGAWAVFAWSELENAISSKQNERFNKIVENAGEAPEALPDHITAEDINKTKMRWRTPVKPDDVVTEINTAIDWIAAITDEAKKGEIITRITNVISALKEPWEQSQTDRSQPNIKELQTKIKESGQSVIVDWKFWPKTFYAMKTYLWVETTRQEDLQYKTNRGRLGGNLSSALDNFEDLAVLQDVLHDEDTNLENLQNRAAEFFEKPLDYVKYMLELSNDTFNVPWKEKIKNIIWSGSESEIKLLQLSLLPAYKWEIDWKMGPLTTKALQTYIEKKWEDWDKNNENILSLSDYNKSVIDWTDKTDANDSFVLIEWTNAQENTAYFFDKTVMNYSCDRLPGLSINTKIGNDDYTYCKTYGWESFKKNNEECVDDTDIKNKLQKIYDKEMALK